MAIGRHIGTIAALLLALAPVPARADEFADDVLAEINFARSHPAEYAGELRQYRRAFDGRLVHMQGETGDVLTREGVAAVDEAIAVLKNQQPLPPLALSALLAAAALAMASEQGMAGTIGHISAGGRTPGQRVTDRGGGPYVAETIAYGSLSPAAVVRQLIVDDSVADRGHRKVIFDARLRFAGVGCAPHPAWRLVCITDYGRTADGRPAP